MKKKLKMKVKKKKFFFFQYSNIPLFPIVDNHFYFIHNDEKSLKNINFFFFFFL